MGQTVQNQLDNASAAGPIAVCLATLRDSDGNGFGSILASLGVPAFLTRSGLTSSATHTEERPGLIHAVLDAAGAVQLDIVYVGVAGAGEVKITYASGVPTLTFGDGANTGYRVLKVEMPEALADKLATIIA